jgi:DNA modification methylase
VTRSPTPYYADESVTLWHGDALEVLQGMPDGSVDCCVTSPPYFGLRDYGIDGQYGLEASPAEYVETMRRLFAEVRRVLADDGTLWLNLGDSYSTNLGQGDVGGNLQGGTRNSYRRDGLAVSPLRRRKTAGGVPAKNLFGIPWRVAFALQDDGWVLRNSIIWHKPNSKPESATDRLTGRHEMVFLLSKSQRYWFDLAAVSSGGSNPGDVWTVPTQPFPGAHFAVMPAALAERCVQAGCKPGGTVLDPFSGSGTTGLAAARHGRRYVGIDLNAEYLDLSLRTRLSQAALDFGDAS